jgi:hypothetical protein
VSASFQLVVVGIVVLVALVYLGRRAWAFLQARRLGACGGCAAAHGDEAGTPQPLRGLRVVQRPARPDDVQRTK